MSTYIYALVITAIFFVTHYVALHTDFNLIWAPYDIFMHVFGGIVIGLFVYAVIKSYDISLNRKRWLVMGGVLVAGILWEIFEMYFEIAGYPFGTYLYYVDTIKDMIDDLAGGLLIAFIWCKR